MPPVHRDLSEFKLKAKPFIKALRVKNDAFCNLMKSKKELERELNKCKRELKEMEKETEARDLADFFNDFHPEEWRNLMKSINDKWIRCNCPACIDTGRSEEVVFRQQEHYVCAFCTAWENILREYDITYSYNAIPDDVPEETYMANISHAVKGPRIRMPSHIVNIGKDVWWRNVGWGQELMLNEAPYSDSRKKIAHLFRILEDYVVDQSANNVSDQDEDDALECAEDEKRSPVYNFHSSAGQRPPGNGPIAMGRGNSRPV